VYLTVRAALLAVILGAAAASAEPAPRWVIHAQDSAREPALRLLALLAQGDIRAAAALSSAPQRRYEVLEATDRRRLEAVERAAWGQQRKDRLILRLGLAAAGGLGLLFLGLALLLWLR